MGQTFFGHLLCNIWYELLRSDYQLLEKFVRLLSRPTRDLKKIFGLWIDVLVILLKNGKIYLSCMEFCGSYVIADVKHYSTECYQVWLAVYRLLLKLIIKRADVTSSSSIR